MVVDPTGALKEIERRIADNEIDVNQGQSLLAHLSGPGSLDSTFANLLLLGNVSAVESYLREIIRKLINIDKESRKACEKQMLTFGAAKTHTPEMLPEALLENYSFANKENISKALRELLGLKGQKSFSSSMEESLNEYENVCHLRHCVVHRFGKLGVNNAIALGLEEHKHCIEKPLQLTFQTLQKISNLCMNLSLIHI